MGAPRKGVPSMRVPRMGAPSTYAARQVPSTASVGQAQGGDS
ncbi:MAG TPA: hypothetical protein VF765_11785 [Polyangiaceae bacterium]